MNSPENTQLVRLIYKSQSALKGTASDVERGFSDILETSRRRNAAVGLTGALMFTRFMFVQALEGPAQAVEETFDRICCDLRHLSIEVLEYERIDEAAFGAWSMSHLEPDGAAKAQLERAGSETAFAEAAVTTLKLMAALLQATAEPSALRSAA